MESLTTSIERRVDVGKVIRNAAVFNFKNWRGGVMQADSLPQTVRDLFQLLHERKTDFLLVGGIALLQYIEGRNTEDIDLIMALSALKKLPEIRVEKMDEYFAQGRFHELRIDILLTRNPLFNHVRQHCAAIQHFVERDLPCATVEGLLLLKLYALPSLYRQGDFTRVGLYENDIATLMHAHQPRLDPLFKELANHMSKTDLDAVKEIVAEIQQRLQRFGESFKS